MIAHRTRGNGMGEPGASRSLERERDGETHLRSPIEWRNRFTHSPGRMVLVETPGSLALYSSPEPRVHAIR